MSQRDNVTARGNALGIVYGSVLIGRRAAAGFAVRFQGCEFESRQSSLPAADDLHHHHRRWYPHDWRIRVDGSSKPV